MTTIAVACTLFDPLQPRRTDLHAEIPRFCRLCNLPWTLTHPFADYLHCPACRLTFNRHARKRNRSKDT